MPILPTSILPKNILAIIKAQANQVQVSPLLIDVAQNTAEVVLGKLQTNENGLSETEAPGGGTIRPQRRQLRNNGSPAPTLGPRLRQSRW